jgi:signal transduction histidine kinase
MPGLKFRLMVTLIISLFVVSTMLISIIIYSSNTHIDKAIKNKINSVKAISDIVGNQQESLYKNRIKSFIDVKSISAKRAMIKAFAERDREALLAKSRPFLKLFRKENPFFLSMGWVTNDNIAFLRTQLPGKFGQDISRFREDAVKANKEKKQVSGYKVSINGFQYSVIQPIFYENKHIGVVHFGINGSSLITTVSRKLSTPVALVLDKSVVGKFNYLEEVLIESDDYIIQSNDLEPFEDIQDVVDWGADMQRVSMNGSVYVVAKVLELNNFLGKPEGNIIAMIDITSYLQSRNKSIAFVIIITTALLVLTIFVVNSAYNKLIQENIDLTESNDYLQERVEKELEKVRFQENIIQQQKKFADMGQMINAIAHQWRQPLNAISLIVQNLDDMRYDETIDDKEFNELVQDHNRLVKHMSETIDDFRNFYSPEKSKQKFSVVYEVASTNALLKAQLESLNISLDFKCMCTETGSDCNLTASDNQCSRDADTMVGYPSELRHIFLNILSNAKDAIVEQSGESGGKIVVDVLVDIDFIRISTFNDGAPIPESIGERIFQPYFTTKDEGKGTGLGLYMSKIIIENEFRGEINYENVEGGVRFDLIIPKKL